MFVIWVFFTGNQLVLRLALYISTLLFFSPIIQAGSKENIAVLPLITKTSLNRTSQLSYKIFSSSKGISVTPVLKGMPPVSISRINQSIQINGEEHFVTISPTTEGKGLMVQTQASNGTSAHLKVYPVQSSGSSHSFYVKDESSDATLLATTNATVSSITVQQIGGKTADDDCDGECKSHSALFTPLDLVLVVALVTITVITIYLCYKCYRSHFVSKSSFALEFIGKGERE